MIEIEDQQKVSLLVFFLLLLKVLLLHTNFIKLQIKNSN